jgi:hypothetical protein
VEIVVFWCEVLTCCVFHSETIEEMPPLEGEEDDASRMEEVD